jgi:hypothetical protein
MQKLILIPAVAIFTLIMQASFAQTASQYAPPPIRETVDGNGVNLVTGAYNASMGGVSIGSGSGALSFGRSWEGNNWRNSFTGTLSISSTNANIYIASIGASSDAFTKSGTAFVSAEANGSTLVLAGTIYTYTTAGGVVATFDSTVIDGTYQSGFGMVTSISYPTGEKLSLAYKTSVYCINILNAGGCAPSRRLQSVTSSSGYMIKLGYVTNMVDLYDNGYREVASVKAINLASDYCDPIADACTGLTQAWPTVTYTYTLSTNNNVFTATDTVTDALGRAMRYTTNANGQLIGIKRPS